MPDLTPTDEAILSAIQATPVALRALEAACMALDAGMVAEATDTLRDAAEYICFDHPELEVGPLEVVLGYLCGEMRRAKRDDEHRRQHMN